MKNRISNIVWGVLFIAVGIGYGGNSLGFWDFSIFFDGWWTLFIIIPCLVNMIQYGVNGGNLVGLCIGAALLLSAQDIVQFSMLRRMFVPAILILVGLSLLLSNTNRKIKDPHGNKIPRDEDAGEISAVFASRRADYSNKEFEGMEINSVFGNVELDLRMAIIQQDVRLDATAVFGGVTILVPSNVIVKVMSTPVLGGVSNKAAAPTEVPCHTLYINATCVFGGVDIR